MLFLSNKTIEEEVRKGIRFREKVTRNLRKGPKFLESSSRHSEAHLGEPGCVLLWLNTASNDLQVFEKHLIWGKVQVLKFHDSMGVDWNTWDEASLTE